jgi:hypothetical protein
LAAELVINCMRRIALQGTDHLGNRHSRLDGNGQVDMRWNAADLMNFDAA